MRLGVLVLALAGLLIAVPADAVDRVVDDAGIPCVSGAPVYTTIDAALLSALPGETILVCAGNYFLGDFVAIDKANVTLQAQGIVRVTRSPGSPPHFGFMVLAEGVTIAGFELSGFLFCAIAVHGDRADIRDNRLYANAAWDAAICVGDFTTGHRIRSNVVDLTLGGGILFSGYAGEISNNRVSRTSQSGIAVQRCGPVHVHHNLVTASGVGIDAKSCDAVIANNTVRGPSGVGIRLVDLGIDGVVSRNAIRGARTGVLLENSFAGTVSFNSIGFNDIGLDVKHAGDVTVTRNNVSRNTTIDCRWDGIEPNILTDNSCGTQDPAGAFD
jgi:hypothetical protein